MEAKSKRLHSGILTNGLKYFAVGRFDPDAAAYSVNKTHAIIHFVSWIFLIISLLGGCFDAATFDEQVLSIAVVGNITLAMSKFATFSLNRSTLHSLIRLIEIDAVLRTKTDVYIKKAIKDTMGTVRSYGFVGVFAGMAYTGKSIFFSKPQSEEAENKYWEVIHIYVPYDVIFFGRFGVARSIITAVSFYHGYCQIFLDIVSASLFTHVGWQFEAVADMFKSVPYSDNEEESKIRLREVIDYHKLILGYAADLQKMYNGAFIVQLIACCLPLCFTMFLIVYNMKTADGSFVDTISHISFLALASFQLFLYTRCADLTKERALMVSEGIYLSDWHLANPSTRRDLAWILTRAQHPIKYSALGIFPMTISTFSQIMRSAYGAFSLMTSMD